MRFLCLLIFLALPACTRTRTPEPLCAGCNVVLVSIDTWRFDRPSFMGYSRATTPRLDSFAARGAVFDNAFVHSWLTMQSHMSMLTGLYPQKHGVLNYYESRPKKKQRLVKTVPTLAESLRRQGLRTMASFFPGVMLATDRGFGRGFEFHRSGHFSVPAHVGAVTDLVGKVSAAPFFLFLHSRRLHDPYILPESEKKKFVSAGYKGMIPASTERLEAGVRACKGKEMECLRKNHAINGGTPPPQIGPFGFERELFFSLVRQGHAQDRQHINDLYDSALYHLDSLLGDLFDRIEALKFPRRTLVILTSDHGEELLEHGVLGHSRAVEPVIHVPLVIFTLGGEFPGKAGARLPHFVETVDIYPTVLELLGLPPQPTLQGKSLAGLLRGEEVAEFRHGIFGYAEMGGLAKSFYRGRELRCTRGPGDLIQAKRVNGEPFEPGARIAAMERCQSLLMPFDIYGEPPRP